MLLFILNAFTDSEYMTVLTLSLFIFNLFKCI